ncbi:MAG: RagB/SusD protein, partial [Segetibacter sp.]|nr:RagB/SusD protein [Segetibacter sp.]
MKRLYKKLLLVLIIFSVSSCKKFLELPSPDNLINGQTVFSNDKTAVSAISGLYTSIMESNNTLFNGNLSMFPGLSADEIIRNYRSQTYDAFLSNSIMVDNVIIGNMWSNAYKSVYQSNSIIEGIAQSAGVSKPLKDQLTGEAKFVRSLIYFYLINLFGDVPLVLTTDYSANAAI